MSTMSAMRYGSLLKYAGDWLDAPLPRPFDLDDLGELRARCGVYIVCEPLERVQYVGSVWRPTSARGVADRLREHLRDGHKNLSWKKAWVIPLVPEVSLATTREVEGCVGAELAPMGANRLPRIA